MATESYAPSSFETGSFQDKQSAPEPHNKPEDATTTHQESLDFGEDDRDNPRTWTQKKKVVIGLFVLLSAFVA